MSFSPDFRPGEPVDLLGYPILAVIMKRTAKYPKQGGILLGPSKTSRDHMKLKRELKLELGLESPK